MLGKGTRRDFLSRSGSALGAGLLAVTQPAKSATAKGPHDFVIVEGHRDMWEISGRTRLHEEAQHLPIANFIAQRLIDGGVSVCIMPASGDSMDERDENSEMFEGGMRVLDLMLNDIEQSKGKATLLRTKADVPAKPNSGKVQIFLDIEGGGS